MHKNVKQSCLLQHSVHLSRSYKKKDHKQKCCLTAFCYWQVFFSIKLFASLIAQKLSLDINCKMKCSWWSHMELWLFATIGPGEGVRLENTKDQWAIFRKFAKMHTSIDMKCLDTEFNWHQIPQMLVSWWLCPFQIWQTFLQHCFRAACHVPMRYEYFNTHFGEYKFL